MVDFNSTVRRNGHVFDDDRRTNRNHASARETLAFDSNRSMVVEFIDQNQNKNKFQHAFSFDAKNSINCISSARKC